MLNRGGNCKYFAEAGRLPILANRKKGLRILCLVTLHLPILLARKLLEHNVCHSYHCHGNLLQLHRIPPAPGAEIPWNEIKDYEGIKE